MICLASTRVDPFRGVLFRQREKNFSHWHLQESFGKQTNLRFSLVVVLLTGYSVVLNTSYEKAIAVFSVVLRSVLYCGLTKRYLRWCAFPAAG